MNTSLFVEGLETFLIGVTVVFTTLVLLIALILILSRIINGIGNLFAKKETPQVQAPVEPIESVEEEATDELELVAVITAAVAVSMGTTTDRLKVRSLRQITKNNPLN